ncbi:MAG: hypothetical protein GX923_07970 [Clostridia bacterium]|jgi:flagellar basal body-associated protein FliL|nr:hypothetical protein [Clostridia bacterium]
MSLNMENNSEQNQMLSRKDKNKSNTSKTIIISLVGIILWGAIVYFGYTYAKDYIDTSIKQVQQENALNIQQLTEEVQTLKLEVRNLTDSIISTGLTLSNSTSIQDQIEQRLEVLDKSLQDLENSLRILQEAPNVKD